MVIEDYRFGRIIIGGKEYRSDLIIYEDRVEPGWWRRKGHELSTDDISGILKNPPEVLVVGRGDPGYMKTLAKTRKLVEQKGIILIEERTPRACQIYNKLKSEGRRVVAALHLTC
jgi:hypothetical protein